MVSVHSHAVGKFTLAAAILACLVFDSCKERDTDDPLEGTLSEGKFSNGYFEMDVYDGWLEVQGNDSSQLLVISKPDSVFSASIVLISLERRPIPGANDYMLSYTDRLKAKPEYELISQMVSLKIDGKTFYYSEFGTTNGVQQVYGVTEMGDYLLGFVVTERRNKREPEVWQMLNSIRFKEISSRVNRRRS